MAGAVLSSVLLGLSIRGILPGLVAGAALVPVLVALRFEPNPWRAGGMTLVANLGILLAAYEGAIPALPWAFPAVLLLSAPGAMFPGLLHALLSRAVQTRTGHRLASLVAITSIPFTWTAVEFLAGRRSLWGQFASPVALGYTQLESPLLPLAALVGVTGVTFGVLLMNVALAVAFLRRSFVPLLVPIALVVLPSLLSSSDVERGLSPETGTVAIVQPAIDSGWYRLSGSVPEVRELILGRLTELTTQVAEADLIVWPETALPRGLELAQLPLLLESLGIESSDLLAGALTIRNERRLNSAVHLYRGRASPVFDKLAPVPVGEAGISPGDRLVVANWGGRWVSPLICLDSLYGSFSTRLARLGAELIVVISDDSFSKGMATPWLHLRASRFRAVETGVPLVFASAWGPSAVVSPTGEIVARTELGTAATLIAAVPRARPLTPYVRWGEWVAMLSLIVTVALLLFYCRSRLRRR